MKNRFYYIGETPAHGAIFRKGIVEIVVYRSGQIRYFPFGTPGKCWQRDKNGMDFYFDSNY